MREHELGRADGVADAIIALSGWLYNDGAATDYLRYENVFRELRESLEGDFFEQLCVELFLENDHTASVEIVPTPGESDDDTPQRLAKMNADLTTEQRKQIVAEEALLRELQEAPDSPAAIATLPHLGVADIDEAPEEPSYALDVDALELAAALVAGDATLTVVNGDKWTFNVEKDWDGCIPQAYTAESGTACLWPEKPSR